ncbi:MAG TPA: hypothetical protein VKQ70_02810, partial [Caulobacteraceae bacterium]|nr:hypothetical protein [Caulobacteraceae bacterium]
MDPLLFTVRHAATLGLCAAAGFIALDPARGCTAGGRLVGAMLFGSAIWAAPILVSNWSASVWFSPFPLAASLVCAVGASCWALLVRDRGAGDNLSIIGPGAILGVGAGLSHGAMLMAVGGAASAVFDDDAFSAGVAIASAFGVLAMVFLSRRWRADRLLAAASLA